MVGGISMKKALKKRNTVTRIIIMLTLATIVAGTTLTVISTQTAAAGGVRCGWRTKVVKKKKVKVWVCTQVSRCGANSAWDPEDKECEEPNPGIVCGQNPNKWNDTTKSFERNYNKWCVDHTGDPNEVTYHGMSCGEVAAEMGVGLFDFCDMSQVVP
jgi:hypothetical protein